MVDLRLCEKRLFHSKNEFMVDSRIVSLESTIDFFQNCSLTPCLDTTTRRWLRHFVQRGQMLTSTTLWR